MDIIYSFLSPLLSFLFNMGFWLILFYLLIEIIFIIAEKENNTVDLREFFLTTIASVIGASDFSNLITDYFKSEFTKQSIYNFYFWVILILLTIVKAKERIMSDKQLKNLTGNSSTGGAVRFKTSYKIKRYFKKFNFFTLLIFPMLWIKFFTANKKIKNYQIIPKKWYSDDGISIFDGYKSFSIVLTFVPYKVYQITFSNDYSHLQLQYNGGDKTKRLLLSKSKRDIAYLKARKVSPSLFYWLFLFNYRILIWYVVFYYKKLLKIIGG